MTISHSDLIKWAATKIRNGKVVKITHPEPTTNFTREHNLKSRKVTCTKCNYVIVTDLPGPKCGRCGENLITMPRKPNELVR